MTSTRVTVSLDTFLRATLPPAFVEFEYLEQGILVAGDWYPLVKMEWVNGEPMNKFVESNLNTPNSPANRSRPVAGAAERPRLFEHRP